MLLAAFMLASTAWLPAVAQQEDSAENEAEQAFATLADEYWAFKLQENPLLASRMGQKENNDKLPGAAPEDHARRTRQEQQFLNRLRNIDQSGLSAQDQINLQILEFILRHDVALAQYQDWRVPILSDSGFHTNINFMARSMRFSNLQDYQDYLSRLQALPGWLRQNVANMRQGIKDGVTQPRAILDNMKSSFAAQAETAYAEHPLYEPFAKLQTARPSWMSAEQAEQLQQQAATVFEEEITPTFVAVNDFFVNEYIPAARTTLGASALPDGKDWYQAQIQYFTTRDDLNAESVHQMGLDEVKRIRAEMQQIIDELDYDGDFASFIDYLRTDPQFYVDTPEQLLKEASWIAKRIDGVLPGYFGKLPRQPYGVEPVPAALAPNYTTGRYSGSPLDSDRGGYYWVNTFALDKRPLYNLTALTLHEAAPGHHTQSALRLEMEDVPPYRQQFYPHAFGEGWALYAEKLGVEMGIYQTPYDHFGRLSYEMWRACRLVIDTGIHAMGWTRQQAQDYLASNTALSMLNVRTEVDRYISWPGQALAYKIGELTILDLRQQAEQALGDDFDLRAFHDAVLADGGLPMKLLRQRIAEFIESHQQDDA
jgi:uncharacterized protein (DUF885 family)